MPRTVLFAALSCVGLSIGFMTVNSKLHTAPVGAPNVARIAPVVGNESHDVIEQQPAVFSPDKTRVAVLQYFEDRWFLNGRAGFKVWLGRSMAQPESYDLIYQSKDGPPNIEWVDEAHLVLSFAKPRRAKMRPPFIPQPPSIARQNAGDVTITYKAATEVAKASYRRSLQDWEQQDRENGWKHYPLSLRFSKMDDSRSHYQDSYAFAQELWAKYIVFRGWAPVDEDGPSSGPIVPDSLSYDAEDVIPSPDGSHIARIVPSHDTVQPAGTASYDVIVGHRDEPREQGITVFRALDGMPAVTWADNNNLTVILAYVSRVQTSLHRAGEVAMSYKLADRLREAQFRDDLHRSEQRQEESEKKITSRTPFDERMEELDRRVQQQTKYYNEFQAWVQENVPEGGR